MSPPKHSWKGCPKLLQKRWSWQMSWKFWSFGDPEDLGTAIFSAQDVPPPAKRSARSASKQICKQYSLAAEFGTGIIPPLVSAGTLVATCWVDGGGCPTFTRLFRLFVKCTVHMIKNERFLVAKWPLSQVSVMCNGCQFCLAVST